MTNFYRKICLLVVSVFIFAFQIQAQDWVTVKAESRLNFSGMALLEQKDEKLTFLVVHDNKDQFSDKIEEGKRLKTERIGILTVENGDSRPTYQGLKWLSTAGTENNLPIDLEAISTVPNTPNRFIATVGNPREIDLKGKVYLIELDEKRESVRVLRETKLPISFDGRDFEGFSVQKIGDILLAVWAERGKNEKPATLFFGELNLQNFSLKLIGETPIQTETPSFLDLTKYPKAEFRSISDVKVDSSGAVFVTSAIDGEDYGIFASEFFYIGAFAKQNSSIAFNKAEKPIRFNQFKNYKAEAFEIVTGKNGGIIFGTDDEDFGASVLMNWR